MADLVVQEAYHTHAADNLALTQAHTLVVAEAYHLHYGDNVRQSFKMWTDVLSPPYLPVPELDAQTDTRFHGLEAGSKLPGIALSARAGSVMSARLPDLQVSAAGFSGSVGAIDRRLPALRCSAQAGARASGRLPIMELQASVSGDLLLKLNRTLPGLSITASGSTPGVGSLDRDLPPIELSASVSRIVTGTLSKSLPAAQIEAVMLPGQTGSLDADIPAIMISTSATAHQDSASLNTSLPTVVMAGILSGQAATISNSSRFTDYVLRHAR